MQILTIEQAINVLDKFEFFSDGGIRRSPDESEFVAALALIKDYVGYEAPLPIVSKARVHRGQNYGGDHTGMFAQFSKNEDGKTVVHLTGRYGNWKDVDIKFTEGDTAIYDSYNFDYLGTIEKITDKAVTIKPNHGSRTKRLDLATFANRNHDFSLEKSHKRRMEWMD